MARHDIITVTDYSATEPYEDPERFSVIPGDIQDVMNTPREEDSLLGKTAMVFDRYMHFRFVHAIVLTMPDYEIFRKFHTKELESCMVNLFDHYTLDHEVFMLNLIPHQAYLIDPEEINADRIGNLFRRWDFIDIGCMIRKRCKVTLEKKGDYLEVKEYPDPNSTTLEYITNNQLVEVRQYASHGYYELMKGGYVPGQYLTPFNVDIAKHIQIRANGIGDAGIRGNFNEIW